MSKMQILGFIIFNIGLILSAILIGKLAYQYQMDVFQLVPVFGSLLLMVGGLLILSFMRDKKL